MLRELEINSQIINFDDYEILEKIGRGSTSNVFRAIDLKEKREVAIRIIKSNLYSLRRFFSVITSLKLLNLPSVVKIFECKIYIRDSNKSTKNPNDFPNQKITGNICLIIIEELMKYNLETCLRTYHQTHSNLTPTDRNKIIFGISSTMKKLHQNRILFRDLKTAHIFLDENFEPKISVCSLATKLKNEDEEEEELDLGVGTLRFMSPEFLLEESNFSFPVDVYSFSVILYLFFSEYFPFTIRDVVNKIYPKRNKNIPDCFWELIQKCWSFDPSDRPTFDEITEMLKDDKFKLVEFGKETDLNELHEYQKKVDFIDNSDLNRISDDFYFLMNQILKK